MTLHFELSKGQLVVRDIGLVPDVQVASKGVARGGDVVAQLAAVPVCARPGLEG